MADLAQESISPNKENQSKLAAMGSVPLKSSVTMLELLRRKEISYDKLAAAFNLQSLPKEVAEQAEIQIKYQGYIAKQKQAVVREQKLESKLMPANINYREIKELSNEAKEKLEKIRPVSLGQASRISGVSPADVSILMIHMEMDKRKGE
jgi:tRNA uridine 5-carboxymethylaminomethyl modification enzyme